MWVDTPRSSRFCCISDGRRSNARSSSEVNHFCVHGRAAQANPRCSIVARLPYANRPREPLIPPPPRPLREQPRLLAPRRPPSLRRGLAAAVGAGPAAARATAPPACQRTRADALAAKGAAALTGVPPAEQAGEGAARGAARDGGLAGKQAEERRHARGGIGAAGAAPPAAAAHTAAAAGAGALGPLRRAVAVNSAGAWLALHHSPKTWFQVRGWIYRSAYSMRAMPRALAHRQESPHHSSSLGWMGGDDDQGLPRPAPRRQHGAAPPGAAAAPTARGTHCLSLRPEDVRAKDTAGETPLMRYAASQGSAALAQTRIRYHRPRHHAPGECRAQLPKMSKQSEHETGSDAVRCQAGNTRQWCQNGYRSH